MDVGGIPPLPLLFRFMLYFARNRASILPLPTRSPRRPEGAADFPCLRQLPPPPFKRRNQRVAGRRRRFQGAKITFRLHERQRPSCEGPKCIIFHHMDERAGKHLKTMIFYSLPPARTRGEPEKTHTFLWFRRAPDRPPDPPRRKNKTSATHGSLVVCEHGRTHKTTIRCDVSHLKVGQAPTYNHLPDPLFAQSHAQTL